MISDIDASIINDSHRPISRSTKDLTCQRACSSVRVPDNFEHTIYCSFCGGEMEES